MSSLIRRIQRQLYPSQAVHYAKDEDGKFIGDAFANEPRRKFYGKHLWSQGRGSKLGVTNPKCKSLLARLAREKRNAERNHIEELEQSNG